LTPEVLKGGEMVNNKRKELNLVELRIILAYLVENKEKNEKLSSTHLREIKNSKCTEETFNEMLKGWKILTE
jgi:phosphopantetheine adenylyltransferase